ncbi:MAG TPA: hypothetical protein VKR53_03955 [Puia sp.]|nr:hypothetical protein [Puia sp.]
MSQRLKNDQLEEIFLKDTALGFLSLQAVALESEYSWSFADNFARVKIIDLLTPGLGPPALPASIQKGSCLS